MLELILASGNNHKAVEFSSLFPKELIHVIPATSSIDVIEDGNTYTENALKKAQGYYDVYKRPVLADDSGLNVMSLPDELGIKSARFGGDGLNDRDRTELLLKKLEGQTKRDAYFSCVLCFYLSPDEIYFFEGRSEGHIAHEIKGEAGFGYDPVFLPSAHPEGKSFAEDDGWKSVNSHRAQACQLAQKFLRERICQNA